jgi:alkylation response protein AidB-like acyl-CoA dehydrogenase
MDAWDPIAPDCRGLNFYDQDPALQDVLSLYLEPGLRAHLEPHLKRLGELAGGRLDELAALSDRHPPVLHPRDRHGRDLEWIEYHPAYQEMERIAFGDLGLHAMGHRGGVLDWPQPLPPLAKYAFQYLFAQAEFGLLCPVNVTDTGALLIERHGSDALRARFLPGMLTQDVERLLRGAQFMTERAGGSDVGRSALTARRDGTDWRLYGEKWFCSCPDAAVALVLARPEGAPPGGGGLGLFVVPRVLEDGTRNRYRIVRLKAKLGSRSLASGEIVFDGALAYPLGDLSRGLRLMMDQVNLSRLSHGVRAAGMMRRCLNEARQVACHRMAFGRRLVEHPLLRRQLLRLVVPTEAALSVFAFTAHVMAAAQAGDGDAAGLLRLLTPLLKFRSCRDNVRVATGAMEIRGGNGYVEDWVNARLVRDAHLGVIWEGTSNIAALDAIRRAVGRARAHEALGRALAGRLREADGLGETARRQLSTLVARSLAFAEEVADTPARERLTRQAASGLYAVTAAVLMAWEGARLGGRGADARRLLVARMLVEHRLKPRDPLGVHDDAWEETAAALLLGQAPVSLEQAVALVAS